MSYENKSNKNGYEIRTEILKMAQEQVTNEYHSRYQGWEVTAARDNNGTALTKDGMPEFPSVENVLKTAEIMYNFVSRNN